MTDTEIGGYWAVIPMDVLLDKTLKPSAKLLYAHLSSLARKSGNCWADNEYLGKLLDVVPDTVGRLIGQLKDRGYIDTETIPSPTGTQRRIYVGAFLGKVDGPPDKKVGRGTDKKVGRGTDKKVVAYNVEDNKYNITPHTPQGGQGECEKKKPGLIPEWKPERFAGLWDFYPAKGRKAKRSAVKAWDKLKADDALIATMGKSLTKLKASDEWQRGIGIPYLSTWLNNARWEDADTVPAPEEQTGGWADDREVI